MKTKILCLRLVLSVLLSLHSTFMCIADVTGGTSTADNLDPYEVGYDFEKGGIYYKILGGDSVSTSEGESPYSGKVVIPDVVEYSGTTYKVTKVSGFRNSPYVTEVTIPKYTETISGFYGRFAEMSGGPGIKSITPKDNTISTIFSSLEKVYFNADSCKNVYFSLHTTTMLGGGYDGFSSPFPFSLKSIVFGDNVERIPNGLLYGCREIEELIIPESVKYIGWLIIREQDDNIKRCELQCSNLLEIAWLPKERTCVELGSNFKTYPCGKEHYLNGNKILNGYVDASRYSNIFHDFIGLNVNTEGMITLPKWVKNIAPNAFTEVGFNFDISIPETITSINESAFADCEELYEVTIPNTVTYIGRNAFSGCSNLKTLNFNADNCVTEGDVFTDCSSLNQIIFGVNVTKIPSQLFRNCSGLKSLNIPNTITEIEERAFENAGLTEVTIPRAMSIIGESAFGACNNLTTLNYNAENCIVESSFAGCNLLCNISFGDNVSKIPESLLYRVTSLKSIEIPNTVTEIGNYAFQYSGLMELTIPESITNIGIMAFANCPNLTTVYFNAINCNKVNGIFNSCEALNKVVFGKSVKIIPESLLMGCANLKEINISDSVTEIGKYAFWGTGIEEITIPSGITQICESPLGSCKNLTTIYYNAKNCTMDNAFSSSTLTNVIIGESVIKIPSYFLNDCEKVTQITIPESVSTIGGFAFAFCNELKTINFNAVNCETVVAPNNISNVFWTCLSLENAVIGENVKKIPDYLFTDCKGLKNVNIPISVTEIGKGAFSSTAITEITIPQSVTYLADNAFSFCDSLKTLYFNAEHCEINSNDIDSRIFYYCNSLVNVYFGENVTKIPVGLLYYCENLSEVEIPSSVTEIGAHSFNGTNISKIVIPNVVAKIGERAFQHCYNLSSITIGKSVQEIGEYAFGTCYNVKTVTSLSQNPSSITDNVFNDNAYNYANLNVPVNSLNSYKNAIGWKKFKNISGVNISGLEEIILTDTDTPVYYNLQGIKVENPQKGIYIKQQGNNFNKVKID